LAHPVEKGEIKEKQFLVARRRGKINPYLRFLEEKSWNRRNRGTTSAIQGGKRNSDLYTKFIVDSWTVSGKGMHRGKRNWQVFGFILTFFVENQMLKPTKKREEHKNGRLCYPKRKVRKQILKKYRRSRLRHARKRYQEGMGKKGDLKDLPGKPEAG